MVGTKCESSAVTRQCLRQSMLRLYQRIHPFCSQETHSMFAGPATTDMRVGDLLLRSFINAFACKGGRSGKGKPFIASELYSPYSAPAQLQFMCNASVQLLLQHSACCLRLRTPSASKEAQAVSCRISLHALVLWQSPALAWALPLSM